MQGERTNPAPGVFRAPVAPRGPLAPTHRPSFIRVDSAPPLKRTRYQQPVGGYASNVASGASAEASADASADASAECTAAAVVAPMSSSVLPSPLPRFVIDRRTFYQRMAPLRFEDFRGNYNERRQAEEWTRSADRHLNRPLRSALLVLTGPVGCGKTHYARWLLSAKGFHVTEFGPNDWIETKGALGKTGRSQDSSSRDQGQAPAGARPTHGGGGACAADFATTLDPLVQTLRRASARTASGGRKALLLEDVDVLFSWSSSALDEIARCVVVATAVQLPAEIRSTASLVVRMHPVGTRDAMSVLERCAPRLPASARLLCVEGAAGDYRQLLVQASLQLDALALAGRGPAASEDVCSTDAASAGTLARLRESVGCRVRYTYSSHGFLEACDDAIVLGATATTVTLSVRGLPTYRPLAGFQLVCVAPLAADAGAVRGGAPQVARAWRAASCDLGAVTSDHLTTPYGLAREVLGAAVAARRAAGGASAAWRCESLRGAVLEGGGALLARDVAHANFDKCCRGAEDIDALAAFARFCCVTDVIGEQHFASMVGYEAAAPWIEDATALALRAATQYAPYPVAKDEQLCAPLKCPGAPELSASGAGAAVDDICSSFMKLRPNARRRIQW